MILRPPISTRTDTLFPYTTLFRSRRLHARVPRGDGIAAQGDLPPHPQARRPPGPQAPARPARPPRLPVHDAAVAQLRRRAGRRSEEHTSELQSLMRISYAVFCLKKKNTQYKTTITAHKSTPS